jgi:hypothetical protein
MWIDGVQSRRSSEEEVTSGLYPRLDWFLLGFFSGISFIIFVFAAFGMLSCLLAQAWEKNLMRSIAKLLKHEPPAS